MAVPIPSTEPEPLRWISHRILIRQQSVLKNVQSSSHQDLWHSTFDDRTFALRCARCDKIVNNPDLSPRWSIYRPRVYLTPWRYCTSEGCKRGNVTMPVDNGVSFTSTSLDRSDIPVPCPSAATSIRLRRLCWIRSAIQAMLVQLYRLHFGYADSALQGTFYSHLGFTSATPNQPYRLSFSSFST